MSGLATHRFDLSGKTALISGGGGLLGPEHAAGLARWGATIVLIDLDEKGLDRARRRVLEQVSNAEVLTYKCDVTVESSLLNLRRDLECKGFGIDILVNNAALNPKMEKIENRKLGPVEENDMVLWAEELKVGIRGTFLCGKVLGPPMTQK